MMARGIWFTSMAAGAVLGAYLIYNIIKPADKVVPVPSFQAQECPFSASALSLLTPADRPAIECGRLHVPEDWTAADSRSLALSVAIFKADDPQAAQEPVIFLNGGPGQRAGLRRAYEIAYWLQLRDSQPWMKKRDLVVFAQRGTDWESGNLQCEDLGKPSVYLGASRNADEVADPFALIEKAYKACLATLSQAGFDLPAFNTVQNARDVAALRSALGYETYSVYGVSYGTQLALTLMQEHPEGLRAVILDSVYPPQIQAQGFDASGFQAALTKVFEGCAEQPNCNAAFPDLERKLRDTVARLDGAPKVISVRREEGGNPLYFTMDGATFLDILFSSLYWAEGAALAPMVIEAAYRQDFETFAELAAADYVFDQDYSSFAHGASISITCNDSGSILSKEKVKEQSERFPMIKSWISAHFAAGDPCADWPRADAAQNASAPVESDIPTLLLSGGFDPVTPVSYAKEAAQTLPKGYLAVFPGLAHGLAPSSFCASEIATAFLDAPNTRPDMSCIELEPELHFIISLDRPARKVQWADEP